MFETLGVDGRPFTVTLLMRQLLLFVCVFNHSRKFQLCQLNTLKRCYFQGPFIKNLVGCHFYICPVYIKQILA